MESILALCLTPYASIRRSAGYDDPTQRRERIPYLIRMASEAPPLLAESGLCKRFFVLAMLVFAQRVYKTRGVLSGVKASFKAIAVSLKTVESPRVGESIPITNSFTGLMLALCLVPYTSIRRSAGYDDPTQWRERIPYLIRRAPEAPLLLGGSGRWKRFWVLVMLAFAQRIYKTHGVLSGVKASLKAIAVSLRTVENPREDGPMTTRDWDSLIYMKDVLSVFAGRTKEAFSPEAGPNCPDVTVVVPVYNGLDHLERLLPALLKHTSESVRLLFVDDASPDPQVGLFLEQALVGRPDAVILRNERNLGFTDTVNRGMALVETPYAVLLNTDVVMAENWLPRLLAPFASTGRSVASVTPFSNAAVFFSFPLRGKDNDFIPPFTLEETDRAFARLNPAVDRRCEIHSGVGFCMAVNMACWKTVGPLDAGTFSRGYGEECDWCMRAISRGWRNVLAPNLFVQHVHGGSFLSSEKKRLCEAHQEILRKRWPNIMAGIMKHVQLNPWEPYRIMASWLMSEGDNGCLLMIDLDENTGGAVAYRESQIRYLQAEGWRIILLRYGRDDGNWFLSIRYLPEERPVRLDSLQDIEHLLDVISVKRVFVNNLAFYANIDEALEFLRRMKRKHPFQLHYVFHDFLSLCPSFFLLDKNNRYCQSGTPERCLSCAHGNLNRVVAFEDLPRWRSWWADFFDVCDSMTCFSQTTKDIVERVYSLGDRLTVQEHMPLAVFTEKFTPPTAPESMELAFVGNFVPQKGSDTIYELAELFIAKGIKARIHIFGLSGVNTPHPRIVRHGTYLRENLPVLFREQGIMAVLFPSVWPETFSYVVQECMGMEVPLVCFDLGAPAERIRKYAYSHAVLAREISGQGLFDALDELILREYGYSIRLFSI